MASMLQVSRLYDICWDSQSLTNKCCITGQIELKSNQLERHHSFAHRKIQKCLMHLFNINKEIEKHLVNFQIDIYFLDYFSTTFNVLKCHFMIQVSFFDDKGNVAVIIRDMLKRMNDKNDICDYRKEFANALIKQLKIDTVDVRVRNINSESSNLMRYQERSENASNDNSSLVFVVTSRCSSVVKA